MKSRPKESGVLIQDGNVHDRLIEAFGWALSLRNF